MSQELTQTVNKMVEKIKETQEVVQSVTSLSRVSQMNEPLKVINKEKMDLIIKGATEINDKVYNLSKGTSQVSRKLQSMSMLFPATATYRVIAQVMAQIEKKQSALKENYFKMRENIIELKKLQHELEESDNEFDKQLLEIKIEKLNIGIADSMSYYEAALKEIGFLTEMYEEIKQNKNIPDEWDEKDYEEHDIVANVMGAFRNGYRDVFQSGRLGMGTMEYFEQYGISLEEALHEIRQYIAQCDAMKQNGQIPDFNHMMGWLKLMGAKYRDNYKKMAKEIGFNPDNIVSKTFTRIIPKSIETAGETNVDDNEGSKE